MIYVATGLNLRKVIAVLKLLTSDKDGEVLAAADALNRMLTTASMTWDEILAPGPGSMEWIISTISNSSCGSPCPGSWLTRAQTKSPHMSPRSCPFSTGG